MIGKGKGDITAQVGKTLKAQEEETHLFLGYRAPPPVFLGWE
jgi:hypothetical protein